MPGDGLRRHQRLRARLDHVPRRLVGTVIEVGDEDWRTFPPRKLLHHRAHSVLRAVQTAQVLTLPLESKRRHVAGADQRLPRVAVVVQKMAATEKASGS